MYWTDISLALCLSAAVLVKSAPTQLHSSPSGPDSKEGSDPNSRVTNDKHFFRNPSEVSVPGRIDTAKNGNPPIQGNNRYRFVNDSEGAYIAPYTPAGGNTIQDPECECCAPRNLARSGSATVLTRFVGHLDVVASEFDYQSLLVG
jgi:hypothetical protein